MRNASHNSISQVLAADYFAPESLNDRMKMYAQQGGVALDFVEKLNLNEL